MRKVGNQAGPRAVSQFVGKSTRAALVRRGFAQADILSKWEHIVGPTLARASSPERMSFGRHNNREATLKVRVAPGFAPEFMQFEPLIIERINSFFGYKAVGRLNLVQAPIKLPQKPEKPKIIEPSPTELAQFEANLTEVQDDELRKRLAHLGLLIKAKKKQARTK